jgi:hypothetical protein
VHRVIRAVFYVVSAPFLFALYATIYGLEDLHGLFMAIHAFYLTEEGKINVFLVLYTVFMFVFGVYFWWWVDSWVHFSHVV